MAFKRSAVRSRLSPPKIPEIERFQVFSLIWESSGCGGGGSPHKRFSFRQRAKGVADKQSNKFAKTQSEAQVPVYGRQDKEGKIKHPFRGSPIKQCGWEPFRAHLGVWPVKSTSMA